MRRMARPRRQIERSAAAAASASVFSRATFEAKVVATTMPRAPAISAFSGSPSVASDRPGWSEKTLVESHISAFTGRSAAMARKVSSAQGSPTTGERSSLKSPEWTIRPAGVSITSAELSGDRVRDGHELHLEGAGLDHLGARAHDGDLVGGQPVLFELQPADGAGETAGIDRRLQPRPQMAERADMVLVGMGDEDRLDPILTLFEPGDVGHDEIDAGRRLHVREGHAEIDDDQPLAPLRPVAVDVAVHPDLARSAERQIDQPVCTHSRSLLYWWIRTRPCMVRSSSTLSNRLNPWSNKGARPPVAMTFIGESRSSRIWRTIPSTRPM